MAAYIQALKCQHTCEYGSGYFCDNLIAKLLTSVVDLLPDISSGYTTNGVNCKCWSRQKSKDFFLVVFLYTTSNFSRSVGTSLNSNANAKDNTNTNSIEAQNGRVRVECLWCMGLDRGGGRRNGWWQGGGVYFCRRHFPIGHTTKEPEDIRDGRGGGGYGSETLLSYHSFY